MQLNGRTAVVTGGGRGIGRGIVERFVEEGARVVVLQRSDLTAELAATRGVQGLSVDLANPVATARAVDRAAEMLGDLDVLVNNAGIMFERSVERITVAEWDLMLAVNLRAPMFLVQAALPFLRRSESGAIINIGSIEGFGSNPQHAAYSASKAGLHGLTRALAVDLGGDGIRVNAIAPGWIESELSRAYLEAKTDPAAARDELHALHPVGRTGTPRDIGDAAVFLASDRAAFLTGETLVVDGGRTVRLPTP